MFDGDACDQAVIAAARRFTGPAAQKVHPGRFNVGVDRVSGRVTAQATKKPAPLLEALPALLRARARALVVVILPHSTGAV
jgi:hypothetical protein